MPQNPYSNIISGSTTGGTAALSINSSGSDVQIAVRRISAIASVASDLHYYVTGTIVYAENEKAYYRYNGTAWLPYVDLPTSTTGSSAYATLSSNYLAGGTIATQLALKQTITDATLNTDAKTIVGAINEVDSELSYLSAGVFGTPATLTDNGDGTATISSFDVLIYPSVDYTDVIKKYTVSGSSFTFTDGAEEYVAVKYNSGSPALYKETTGSLINNSNILSVFTVWRQGTTIHSLNFDSLALGLSNKAQSAMYHTEIYRVSTDGGLVIAETTTPNPRTITVSGGIVYTGAISQTVGTFNSSTDLFTFAYHTSGSWIYSSASLVYPNNVYDNGTNLVAIPDKKYGVFWYYRSIGDAKQLFYVAGDNYYSDAGTAGLSQPRTDLNALLKKHCKLIGRSIIKLNATSGSTQSTMGISFTGTTTINHNDTSNIQGGSSADGEYYHLSGSAYTEIQSFVSGSIAGGLLIGDTTNNSFFETDGTLVFSGSATVWNDILVPLTTAKQGPNNKPAFNEATLAYDFPQNDPTAIMFMVVQMSHSYKEGTDVHPHVHWNQNQSGSPLFYMDYKWFNIGDQVPANWTTHAMTVPTQTYTSGSLHQLTSGSANISGSGKKISSIMLVKLYRNDNVYVGNVSTYQWDLHYEIDTVGSRTLLVK